MKFLKISVYSLLAILLVLAVGAGIFLATFDAEMLKSTLVKAVKEKTGRELTLGTIEPTIFPWIGAELTGVGLSNAAGFEAEKMLAIEQLNVHLELLPLLKREINVDTLQVNGLKLFLEKNQQGITNWSDLVEPSAKKAASPSAAKTIDQPVVTGGGDVTGGNTEQGMSTAVKALRIQGVDINGADIHWHDALSGKKVELQRLNIKTGAVVVGEPLSLQVSSQLDLPESNMAMLLNVETRITYDAIMQRVAMDELALSIDAKIKEAAIEAFQLSLSTQLSADIEQQQVTIPSFKLLLNAQGGQLAGKSLKAALVGGVMLDWLNQTATIKPLTLTSGTLKINSPLQIKNLSQSPEISGQINVPSFNPAEFARSIGVILPEMQSKTALTRAALNGQFHVTEKQLTLKPFQLKLDQSIADIQFQLNDFKKPSIGVALVLDRLNLDEYLPPEAKPLKQAKSANKKSQAVVSGAKKPDQRIELPVEMLRALDVKGKLTINNLKAFDTEIKNTQLQIKAQQGRINITELTAKLLGGSINASSQLDVRQKIPRYKATFSSRDIEIKTLVTPLLVSVSGKESLSLSGASNMQLDLTTQGDMMAQLKSQLNGKFALNMGVSKLHGVDVEYFAHQDMIAFLEKNKLDVPDHLKKAFRPKSVIALKKAKLTADIVQGVIINNDLLLMSSKMEVTGAGKINLPKEKLDYQLAVSWMPDKKETLTDRLIALPMPVKINGDFSQPDIRVDWKSRLKAAKKLLKTEAKNKVKDKAERKLERKVDKIKDRLKNLFN